jgi:hypothetical protein
MQSTVRCSIFPLAVNPYEAALQKVWKYGFYEPLDTASGGFLFAFEQRGTQGRRYKLPTLSVRAWQIFFSCVAGMAVAMIQLLPVSYELRDDDEENNFERCSLLLTCCFTIFYTLVPMLDEAHELDPGRYHKLQNSFATVGNEIISKTLVACMLVPAFSCLLARLTYAYNTLLDLPWLWTQLAVRSGLITSYVLLLEEISRTYVFRKPMDFHEIDAEVGTHPSSLTLGVILSSILADESLALTVWESSYPSGVEIEEIKLVQECSAKMASVLLHHAINQSEAAFEEDALRISILESLGGTVTTFRHHKAIHDWFAQSVPMKRQRELLSTYLLRGLCIFVSGFGEALERCVDQKGGQGPWTLPPASYTAITYAVNAISRFAVESLATNQHHLFMVPAALESLFRLRAGFIRYSNSQDGVPHDIRDTISNNVGGHESPQYWKIVTACESCAIEILGSLQALQNISRIDYVLTDSCKAWKRDILGRRKITSKSESLRVA